MRTCLHSGHGPIAKLNAPRRMNLHLPWTLTAFVAIGGVSVDAFECAPARLGRLSSLRPIRGIPSNLSFNSRGVTQSHTSAVTDLSFSLSMWERESDAPRMRTTDRHDLSAMSSESSSSSSDKIDWSQIGKYGVATGLQFGAIAATLRLLDISAWKYPKYAVGLLFAFLSLRSRIASPLDNSRQNRETQGGKATPTDLKRPSWTPPVIAIVFIWLTITALRVVSSALVYRKVGKLFSPPLLAMILHLCVGDTWNTINNIEKRLGVSSVGILVVWATVWNAIFQYYGTIPLAGKILAPSGAWLSIATVLTWTVWRINKPVQSLYPIKGVGESAAFRWANLGQLQPTSIGGSIKNGSDVSAKGGVVGTSKPE